MFVPSALGSHDGNREKQAGDAQSGARHRINRVSKIRWPAGGGAVDHASSAEERIRRQRMACDPPLSLHAGSVTSSASV